MKSQQAHKCYQTKTWYDQDTYPERLNAAFVGLKGTLPNYVFWIDKYCDVAGDAPVVKGSIHIGELALRNNRTPGEPASNFTIEDLFDAIDEMLRSRIRPFDLLTTVKLCSIIYGDYPITSGDVRIDVEIDGSLDSYLSKTKEEKQKQAAISGLDLDKEYTDLLFRDINLASIRYITHGDYHHGYGPTDSMRLHLVVKDAKLSSAYELQISWSILGQYNQNLLNYSEGDWVEISQTEMILIERIFPYFLCLEEIKNNFQGRILYPRYDEFDEKLLANMMLEAFLRSHEFAKSKEQGFSLFNNYASIWFRRSDNSLGFEIDV
ncbi:hypothetical protein [Ruegeria sp. HKCCA5763]|uniref:hypothetical protein n=1 Tax=Ruegeria sp. HKCCA5763 TaxID=2682987 RepID=UPI001C2CA41B|nr:hypothetical protein [Ruegeria sp. HKCCA5763]